MKSDDFTRHYIIRYLSLFYPRFLLDPSLTKSVVNVYAENNLSRSCQVRQNSCNHISFGMPSLTRITDES